MKNTLRACGAQTRFVEKMMWSKHPKPAIRRTQSQSFRLVAGYFAFRDAGRSRPSVANSGQARNSTLAPSSVHRSLQLIFEASRYTGIQPPGVAFDQSRAPADFRLTGY